MTLSGKSRAPAKSAREQASLFPSDATLPEYEEIVSAESLRDANDVLLRLSGKDWAFTEDETTFLSHGIHPYPAKFIPQLPGQLIANLTLRGETVLDPFGGSGTTALEAARLGRSAISIDASPLAALIGRAKTARIDGAVLAELGELRATLGERAEGLSEPPGALVTRYAAFVPDIPNIEHWFPCTAVGELACIRASIGKLHSEVARDVASLAMSRIVLRVSYQDSETRYKRTERTVPQGTVFKLFVRELKRIVNQLREASSSLSEVSAEFITGDSRALDPHVVADESIDAIVTSPPYGNATDYHLYLRFRMFWLGFDPRDFARVEIGSHLKHQREKSGFESYVADLLLSLGGVFRVLKPGRYAALVIGGSVYEGRRYDTAQVLGERAQSLGFEFVGIVSRPIHDTKRSFVAAARRANEESLLLLRKPAREVTLRLSPPSYRMWKYEEELRVREVAALLGEPSGRASGILEVSTDPYRSVEARRLAFSSTVLFDGGTESKTWQSVLENGHLLSASARKDPKYVTHGLHPYKGKFYPQLAKALLNIAGVAPGALVLDPFCGSGTTLLESKLNGLQAHGCDLHPLAAAIARTKTSILDVDAAQFIHASRELERIVATAGEPHVAMDQFHPGAVAEIEQWFAPRVSAKLNFILKTIRDGFSGVEKDYFELILSSVIRGVSHQEPTDLRIRRRKQPLTDADVFGIFLKRMHSEIRRLKHFWSKRNLCPFELQPCSVVEADARQAGTYRSLGLTPATVDFILTSPPYATALPYIDTDRLSLLVLYGMTSKARRPVEHELTGSREIGVRERKDLDWQIENARMEELPAEVRAFVTNLHRANSSGKAGFRKRNLPSLLLRFFRDMSDVVRHCHALLRPGGEAMVVIGDNYTVVNGERMLIPTTQFLVDIAASVGLTCTEQIPIDVTVENLRHIRHSITRNTVLRLHRG